MKRFLVTAFFPLLACGDSTGPELQRLHDGYVMERLGNEAIPAPLRPSLILVSGGVVCPPLESSQPMEEVYTFDFTDPLIQGLATLRFDVECEVEMPNRIRYTYPATGETIIGTVWKGVGEGEGQFFQTKKLPSRATFLATVESLGWHVETWSGFAPRDPAPEGIFRRHR